MLKIALFVLVLLVLVPFVIGWFLPSERHFVKKATLPHDPAVIWAVITDLEGQLQWRPEVASIQIHQAQKGAERWTEVPHQGPSLTFQTKTYDPPHRFDLEIVDSGIEGYWEGRLKPTDTGSTAVEFREVIVVNNPYQRLFSYLFVDLNDLMELYLNQLQAHLAQQAR